tara:strand:- start:883 stop:1197 length:315 start_codon:yes stop_codon:yes gene_type:complete
MKKSITPITKELKKVGLVRVTFTKRRFWERGVLSSLYDVPTSNDLGFSISKDNDSVLLQVENAKDIKEKQLILNEVIEVLDANGFQYEKNVHLGNILFLIIDKV